MEDIGGLQKYLDGLPELERAVRHKGFVSLVHDQPCTVSTLAHQLGQTETVIKQTITAMEKRGTLIWDHTRHELNATGGLSLTPTSHRLRLNQREMFAWCAADAVGIPAALSLDAEIDSACQFCRTPIHIAMKKGRILEAAPQNPQVFVAHADPAQSVSGHT